MTQTEVGYDEENPIHGIASTVTDSSEDELHLKFPRFETSVRVMKMAGIFPSMTMPEYSIDKNVRHFVKINSSKTF